MDGSRAEFLASLPKHEREVFLLSLTPEQAEDMLWDWHFWARPDQLAPPGEWATWLALAGRGFGKTRLGAEWIREQVCGPTPMARGPCSTGRLAIVGKSVADVRDVMIRGPSGILAVHPPDFRPTYTPSLRMLEWPNGAIALTFSAEEPDQLRGPEQEVAWADEAAKWKYADDTWDMLQFGMRIGEPRQLVTTTPRPIKIIRDLLALVNDPDPQTRTVVTRGSTYANIANLSQKFIKQVIARYEGTRLGRQELGGEVLDDVPGALWTRQMLDRRSSANPKGAQMAPGERVPPLTTVVVGVDPSGSSGEEDDDANAIGILTAAAGEDGQFYVLEDSTCQLGPAGWARTVVRSYEKWQGDRVVGERNFGGAMVEHTIRTAKRNIAYRDVVATRGKVVRAEPIAAMYEQGRIRHLGSFPELEDEMCAMTRGGYQGGGSPNRVDALVWALTDLIFGKNTRGGSTTLSGGHH